MPSLQTVLFPPTSSVTVPEFRLCPDRSVKSFVLLQAALKKIPTATLAAAFTKNWPLKSRFRRWWKPEQKHKSSSINGRPRHSTTSKRGLPPTTTTCRRTTFQIDWINFSFGTHQTSPAPACLQPEETMTARNKLFLQLPPWDSSTSLVRYNKPLGRSSSPWGDQPWD